jgi:hypothetical protein
LALVLALLPPAVHAAKKEKPMEWKGQYGGPIDAEERVVSDAKGADVTVRYKIKEPTGFTTQAISQPWKVRAFARVKGKVFISPVKEVPPK